MEARDGVAIPVGKIAPALGPLYDRKEANALPTQPGILLSRGKIDIGFCPATRPEVFFSVKSRTPHPVLQGKIVGVSSPRPPWLRGVAREGPPKDPKRFPTHE